MVDKYAQSCYDTLNNRKESCNMGVIIVRIRNLVVK